MKALVLLLAAMTLAVSPAAAQPPADRELPRAHFYSQAGGDTARPDDGFLVADRPGFGFTTGRNFVRFWSEFKRYGGAGIIGYPASRPFEWDGFDVQVFQKGVFQWRPEQAPSGQAWFMNVFDEFTRRGLDQRLLVEKQVPLPATFNDSGKSFEQIMSERLALLANHPAMLDQYWSVPDPLALYGLPTSAVDDFGPFFAVRLQRAAFQQWKVDAPGIALAGQVTVVNAGDAAKQFGLIPAHARIPVPPPMTHSNAVAVYTPGVQESVSSPFTVAGDAQAFEATIVWELTNQRGDVLSRSFAMAAACCEWSSFEFEVPYAVPAATRASLAIWGSSGRDAAERPGEVRVPLELQNLERPGAAKDGRLLIEPLRRRADGTVTVRVRNESGFVIDVPATEFGVRDDTSGQAEWSSASTVHHIPAGESREVELRFALAGGNLRLLHRGEFATTPVVIDLPAAGPSARSPIER